MEAGALGDHVGEALADRYLYHFVIRRYALQLLGAHEEWGGLDMVPNTAGPRPK